MNRAASEETSQAHPLIEKFAHIQETYGRNYPIILYEPSINCQEKKDLRDILRGRGSIRVFSEFKKAFKLAQSLGISFILIASKALDEKAVIKNFRGSEKVYGHAMLDFEEDAVFQDIFPDTSDDVIKSLKIKGYVFITLLDFLMETDAKEDEEEEEVMIVSSVKDMTEKFRQEYNVIWYDPENGSKDKAGLKQRFDIEERNIFDNFAELYKRIYSSGNPPFHLILTGKDEAKTILDEISHLKEMLCLYIYCDDPEIMKKKKRNIFVEETIEKLIPKITQGIREKSKLTNSFPAFATDFDALDKSGIYSLHHYLQEFIRFKNSKQAKQDFLNLGKKIYESKKLLEFQKDYHDYKKSEIFQWYAIESPIYKLVNNCLRIATSDSILYCRFILKDLEKAIKEEYQEKSHKFNGVVYRGAFISQDEWEKLQNNIGKEIEMYGFLSTSENLETAKNFCYSDPINKILITIIVPPLPALEVNQEGFANISHDSGFNEAEILFNVRSRFQILEAQDKDCRHLVLLYGAQLLRKYMTKVKPAISLKLELSPEIKCNFCGSNHKLFGFIQGVTEVRCAECLKSSFPQDIPLFSLDSNFEENKAIEKRFQAKILKYNQKIDLPFYGYKCYNCQESGKKHYYKWVAPSEQKTYEQCSECFNKGSEINAEILLSESNPYRLWLENETKMESIDNDYQTDISRDSEYKSHGEVYLEVQNFSLAIRYGKNLLEKLKIKRKREWKKLESLEILGKGEQNSGRYEKALEYYEKGLDVVISFFGEEHFFSSSFLHNVAVAHLELKNHQKALYYHQKVLDLRKLYSGEKTVDTAESYEYLGLTYWGLEKSQQALKYHQKALEIRKEILGENHPSVANSYDSIASVYTTLEEYQQAIGYHQKAQDIKLAIYGEKHFETAISFQNIGAAYQRLRKYDQALEYYLKALATKKIIYGEKHREIADLYNNIAMLYLDLELPQNALEYQQEALEINIGVFGEDNPATALSFVNIASIYRVLRSYEKALKYQQKVLSIKEFIEDESSGLAHFYHNHAAVYRALGKYQEELEFQLKALNIRKLIYGEKHCDTAGSLNDLGILHQNLGKYQQAFEYHQKALDIRKEIYGENHPETASSYHNIALVEDKLGKYQQSMTHLTKALEIYRKVYGEKHRQIATAYNSIAGVCDNLGENQKGLGYHKKALDLQIELFGENHKDTAASLHNIGVSYQRLKEYKLALEYHKKSLSIKKTLFDENHPDIAISYFNIAIISCKQKDFQKALEYHEKTLHIRKTLYGENHPEIANSYVGLSCVYEDLKEYKRAHDYGTKALDIYKSVYGSTHLKTLELEKECKDLAQKCQSSEK